MTTPKINRFAFLFAVFAVTAVLIALLGGSDMSDTEQVRENTVTVHQPDRELHYVEPLRIEHDYPTRVYVEFSDSHEVVLPPCAEEDSDDCFWWAPARGNGKGESFVTVDGRVFPLQQGGEH